MRWLEYLKAKKLARERRMAFQSFRATLASFGVDVSSLSDEEIEYRISGIAHALAATRVGAGDAARAFQCLFGRSELLDGTNTRNNHE